VRTALDVFLHLDRYLNTGLVVTPFLPGDSLLFAVGALAPKPGSPINLPLASVLLCVATILGDAVNYSVGARVGPKVFTSETARLLNKQHLMRTQRFYGRYGGKAIFLARVVPIIPTFAPFVAGIGRMPYSRFAAPPWPAWARSLGVESWRPGAGRVLAQRLPEHGTERGRLPRGPRPGRALQVARNPPDEVDPGLRRPDQGLRHEVRRVDVHVKRGCCRHDGVLLAATARPLRASTVFIHSLYSPPVGATIGPKPKRRCAGALLPCR
jgi:membrane protein YqaA with SNARE-associated domain